MNNASATMFDMLKAGPKPMEPVTREARQAFQALVLEHGLINVICILGSLVEDLLGAAADAKSSAGPLPDLTTEWRTTGAKVVGVLIPMVNFAQDNQHRIKAIAADLARWEAEGEIDLDGGGD